MPFPVKAAVTSASTPICRTSTLPGDAQTCQNLPDPKTQKPAITRAPGHFLLDRAGQSRPPHHSTLLSTASEEPYRKRVKRLLVEENHEKHHAQCFDINAYPAIKQVGITHLNRSELQKGHHQAYLKAQFRAHIPQSSRRPHARHERSHLS